MPHRASQNNQSPINNQGVRDGNSRLVRRRPMAGVPKSAATPALGLRLTGPATPGAGLFPLPPGEPIRLELFPLQVQAAVVMPPRRHGSVVPTQRSRGAAFFGL